MRYPPASADDRPDVAPSSSGQGSPVGPWRGGLSRGSAGGSDHSVRGIGRPCLCGGV